MTAKIVPDATLDRARNAIVGIGTASWTRDYGIADPTTRSSAPQDLLERALNGGVAYLDTAAAYGDSEAIIGTMASSLAARNVRVCTKIKVHAQDRTTDILSAIRASLERLGSSGVDTLYLHSASVDDLEAPSVGEALEHAKATGWIRRAGASTYGSRDALVALSHGWCDVVQVEFSVLNQSVYRAVTPSCASGKELVVRSVLCKGLLTDRRRFAGAVPAHLRTTLHELDEFARASNMSLAELAIRFALDTAGVDVVVVGVSTVQELDLALAAACHPPLTHEQRAFLETFDRSDCDAVHPERWGRM